jgi:hypothetical protein
MLGKKQLGLFQYRTLFLVGFDRGGAEARRRGGAEAQSEGIL